MKKVKTWLAVVAIIVLLWLVFVQTPLYTRWFGPVRVIPNDPRLVMVEELSRLETTYQPKPLTGNLLKQTRDIAMLDYVNEVSNRAIRSSDVTKAGIGAPLPIWILHDEPVWKHVGDGEMVPSDAVAFSMKRPVWIFFHDTPQGGSVAYGEYGMKFFFAYQPAVTVENLVNVEDTELEPIARVKQVTGYISSTAIGINPHIATEAEIRHAFSEQNTEAVSKSLGDAVHYPVAPSVTTETDIYLAGYYGKMEKARLRVVDGGLPEDIGMISVRVGDGSLSRLRVQGSPGQEFAEIFISAKPGYRYGPIQLVGERLLRSEVKVEIVTFIE